MFIVDCFFFHPFRVLSIVTFIRDCASLNPCLSSITPTGFSGLQIRNNTSANLRLACYMYLFSHSVVLAVVEHYTMCFAHHKSTTCLSFPISCRDLACLGPSTHTFGIGQANSLQRMEFKGTNVSIVLSGISESQTI